MAAEEFKYLFAPLDIGPMTVKNRLVFLPHTHGFASGGMPDERHYSYTLERARGGVGMIIEGSCLVHSSSLSLIAPFAFDERIVPVLRRVADGVHQYGTKYIIQLNHFGGETLMDRQVMWAPSAVPDPITNNECPRSITKEEIREVIAGYVKSALHVKQSGCDGVELKACHDGLLRQFLSPATNLRQDEYGGSLDNRMRLFMEVLKEIRSAVGPDFVIGVRPCLDELKPRGYNLQEGVDIARRLAQSGFINYLSADVATSGFGFHLHIPSMDIPLGSFVFAAAALREVVDLPVIATLRINDPMQAEKILADGYADLIGMCRQLICDPETPNKAKEGRTDDVRHCMACNLGCIGGLFTIGSIRCVHNPAVGAEKELGIGTLKGTDRKKKIVVVGGGPSGMKVAEIAAQRGHQVTLYEKDSELGGQVRLADKGPHREDFGEVTHWLEIQLGKLGVKVMTNVEATSQLIEIEKPDAVIIATGARLIKPRYIPGAEQENVVTPWEVLGGSAKVGQKVLVYSGWKSQVAASAAELLANEGKEVEIITPLLYLGMDIHPPLSLVPPTGVIPLYLRLLEKKVVLTPFSDVTHITGNTVTILNVYSQQSQVRTGIDTVVLSTCPSVNDNLYYEVKGKVKELYRIGDCVAPRQVDKAIYEGEMLGRAL